MSIETQDDEQWKLFLEGSMFEDHFNELEKICEEVYGGHSELFDDEFLRPICSLLLELRTSAETFFSNSGMSEERWLPCYERFVTSVIHLSQLDINLHKGEFYFHLKPASPGEIILKYYDSKKVMLLPLTKSEYDGIWASNWNERKSKQMKNRFLFLSCIVRGQAGKGFERRPWRYIMAFDTMHRRQSSKDLNTELSPRTSRVNSIKMFTDLSSKPLTILDVNFEVIHSNVICLPGTRDARGAPVIFLDAGKSEWQIPDFNSEEIARICLYFLQIPREEVSKLGLSIFVDARNADHNKKTLQIIGKALVFFEEMKPGSVHIAYLLGRKDSHLLMFSADKLKEKLKFQFKLLSSFDDVLSSISMDQIPTTFGGSFEYDHDAWLQFRLKQETFMTGCRSATKLALTAIDELGIRKFGETVEECQRLLEEHDKKLSAIFSDSRLSALQVEGEQLVADIQQTDCSNKTQDWKYTMEIVSKLYEEMNQVFSKLEVLYRKRKHELKDCLQLKCFQEEYAKVLKWLQDVGMPHLKKPVEIAKSYKQALSYHDNFKKFLTDAKSYILQAQNSLEDGSDIAQLGTIDFIDEKEMSKVLKTILDQFTTALEERRVALVTCIEFHKTIRECSEWRIQALKHMAFMNMEASNSSKGVASLKESMEGFLQEFPMWSKERLNNLIELSGKLKNEDLQNQAEKSVAEYKEVKEKFLKRQETLQGAAVCVQTAGEDDEQTYQKLSETTKKKLLHIVDEMATTERDYVNFLNYVIQNYVKEMESDDLPASLRGKKNLIFGNIEKLYEFHQRNFSQELEQCLERPYQVAATFLKWERQFFLYALYNKNKPTSDKLLHDHGSAHFRKRQDELHDKLDLCSYLLKPVQRIGKYALFLQEMIKVIEVDSSSTKLLRHAEEMVKYQLRHGNDLLAMDSIRECNVNLKEQGKLLLVDDFTVWQDRRKCFRRVFLFEDVVIFSKAKEQTSGADIFIYKSSLKTADIGLREAVGENVLRFELWLRRRQNARDTFTFEAKSIENKRAWVKEIRRLLECQAVRNKRYSEAEATTGISVGSQPGEQVLTTRSSIIDDSSNFSPTITMQTISSTYNENMERRRLIRRMSTMRRGSTNCRASGSNYSREKKSSDETHKCHLS
ncbi:pleckstrin homology domain-containing family G member 4B-like [Xenia sp. Carnegie-2017]|uniref:pleckstrin homology domain-containing family G member 4B-like n=1 Tax=Xenia sp. Carnegie-2017 TaxID=2897299 RepID=UPI001F041104|nr:pleckstrin homology domain-containing family G member 4B-like [Xenia sp. Carnegie-2017]